MQALLPHFEYPPLARRRGWQGRVRIGLLVEADGQLSRVQLVESSGYTLLDKAAMKNVNQLRNVPGATQWLDGRDLCNLEVLDFESGFLGYGDIETTILADANL